MILQTAEDVTRELLRNPGREYDLKRSGSTMRVYSTPHKTITLWAATMSRPVQGFLKLTEFDLGPGPYELVPVSEVAR